METFTQALERAVEHETCYHERINQISEEEVRCLYRDCIKSITDVNRVIKNTIYKFVRGIYQIKIDGRPRLASIGFEEFTRAYPHVVDLEPQFWFDHDDNYILQDYLYEHFDFEQEVTPYTTVRDCINEFEERLRR